MRKALFVLCSVMAVAADKPKFAPGKAASHAGAQTSDKITVAAIPYITAEQDATVFGKAKPHEEGILPVLVIVDNNTGKGLRLDLVAQYIDQDGQNIKAMPPDLVTIYHTKNSNAGVPRTSPLPPIRTSAVKKGPLNTPEIEGRAFAVHLVPPGESAFGFFYFEVNYLPGARLYLNGLKDAASGREYIYFEVPIEK